MTGGEDNDRDPIKNHDDSFPTPISPEGIYGITLSSCGGIWDMPEYTFEVFTFIRTDRQTICLETLVDTNTCGELLDEFGPLLNVAEFVGEGQDSLFVATLSTGCYFVRISDARDSRDHSTSPASGVPATDAASAFSNS